MECPTHREAGLQQSGRTFRLNIPLKLYLRTKLNCSRFGCLSAMSTIKMWQTFISITLVEE